jgi:hypothetical protein
MHLLVLSGLLASPASSFVLMIPYSFPGSKANIDSSISRPISRPEDPPLSLLRLFLFTDAYEDAILLPFSGF